MALTDNLVSYWKCDEASGNLVDAHGSHTLTDNNTVGATTGKINNGRDFEKDNTEYFTKSDHADLSTGDIDFTWAFWVNVESENSEGIIWKAGSWPNGVDYAIYLFGGDIVFRVGNGSTGDEINTGINTGTWYHVVCHHDSVNNQIAITLDAGTPVTKSYSSGASDSSGALFIGSSNGVIGTFDGVLDEIGFWKRVLTSQERTDLYNGGSGLSYDDFGGGGGGGLVGPLLRGRLIRGGALRGVLVR